MMEVARCVRNDLYIIAELFSGSLAIDSWYCSHIGINGLLREAIHAHSPSDLAGSVQFFLCMWSPHVGQEALSRSPFFIASLFFFPFPQGGPFVRVPGSCTQSVPKVESVSWLFVVCGRSVVHLYVHIYAYMYVCVAVYV